MRGIKAFIKKEILEQIRTYRFIIMLAVFAAFGIMSPLFAKLTPEILSSLDMQGATIILPDPTAVDSYVQFHKNITQMGLIAILLIFGGTLSNEMTKGTLVNLLSKGLDRRSVIFGKYVTALGLWTVSFLLASVVNYIYMLYFFDVSILHHLVLAHVCLWLYGAYIISLILLSSILAQGNFGGLIFTAAILIVLVVLNIVPVIQRWNPMSLSGYNTTLIVDDLDMTHLVSVIIITVIALLGNLVTSSYLFKKKTL